MTRSEFRDLYADCLAQAVLNNPDQYSISIGSVGLVADKMMAALDRGSANITGSIAFKALAKRLQIKHTVRDITAARKACVQ